MPDEAYEPSRRFRVHVEGWASGALVSNVAEVDGQNPGEALNRGIVEFAIRFGLTSRCERAHLEVLR